MNNKYIFIANWKMNMSCNKAIEFAAKNYDSYNTLFEETKQTIILCPSYEVLHPFQHIFADTNIFIGAQGCSAHQLGAFTGQIPIQSLQDLGVSFCIIGHSEQRQEFCETNDTITKKCIHLLDHDISPIVCIGESAKAYNAGNTFATLEEQLTPIFTELCTKTTIHPYLTPYIAYEPLFAIGTGKAATQEHLESVFTWLKAYTQKHCPGITWKFLYGGSVHSKNIGELKKNKKISGFLIGKASLDFQEFKKIVQSAVVI